MKSTQFNLFIVIIVGFIGIGVSIALHDKSRWVPLQITTVDPGIMTVNIEIGIPPRPVVMMLDFESDTSGIWTQQLDETSKTFCDDCYPIASDLVFFGAYRFRLELLSVQDALLLAQRTQTVPPSFPSPPAADIDGWLGLSPRSQIFLIWDTMSLSSQVLQLSRWHYSGHTEPFITRRDKEFPNVPLLLHRYSNWWDRAWLVTVDSAAASSRPQHPQEKKDIEWLRKHHTSNASLVLFTNNTQTWLSQRLYNSLFYRSNLYHPHSLPEKILLAPGLYLHQRDWYSNTGLLSSGLMRLGYVPREQALAMKQAHPTMRTDIDQLSVLSTNTIFPAYKLKFDVFSGELALVQVNINCNVSWWKLALTLFLLFLLMVVFLSRTVFLRHRNVVQQALRLDYHTGGYGIFILVQTLSVTCSLIAYLSSSKLRDMRLESRTDAVAIFWVLTIGGFFFGVCALFNILIYVVSWIDKRLQRARLRARMFVITQVIHVELITMAVWFILIDRTSSDITNVPAALVSGLMLLLSVMSSATLYDWITYRGEGGQATRLWPQLFDQSGRLISLSEPLSFYYATFILMVTLAWTAWLCYFSGVMQIFELLRLEMTKVSDFVLRFASITVVLTIVDYGLRITDILTQMNHIPPIDVQMKNRI